MTLRRKLVLAQTPLALALVIVGMVSAIVTTRLGERSRLILAYSKFKKAKPFSKKAMTALSCVSFTQAVFQSSKPTKSAALL